MENKQTEKSQAELYREERKQRMAKAAKKNSKKSPQLAKAGHVIGKVISALVVIALCLAVIYGCLSFFGVPQKVLKATTINGTKVSVAKYNFYYMSAYLNAYNQSYTYDSQYGQGMGKMYTGYDYTVSPLEQNYAGTLEGYDNPTWADAFKESALMYIKTYVSYSQLAKDEGVTLTDEQKEAIDEQISSWKETAEQNDYSLNRFLARQYGAGVNEKLVRAILEEQYLAENFAEKKNESIQNAITDEQIETEIAENAKDYKTFDISVIAVDAVAEELADDASEEAIKAAEAEAKKDAKSKADSILSSVTSDKTALEAAKKIDEKATEDTVNFTGTKADTITKSFGSAVTDWVFDSERAVGDKAVIETDDGYAVVYLSSLPATDDTKGVDVKHILIAFPTEDDGTAKKLSDEEKATYYDNAKKVLDAYLADPTEENFTTLASEKSEDPGSKDKGGLYECVYPGAMVTEFNDWIFDSARKPGDTDIVETSYGYHVMLYIGNDNPTVSENAAKSTLANNALDEFDLEITGGSDKHIERSEFAVNWTCKKLEKIIANQYIGK